MGARRAHEMKPPRRSLYAKCRSTPARFTFLTNRSRGDDKVSERRSSSSERVERDASGDREVQGIDAAADRNPDAGIGCCLDAGGQAGALGADDQREAEIARSRGERVE